jgi:hypothetical protein
MTARAASLPVGTIVDGRYEVQGVIGTGGCMSGRHAFCIRSYFLAVGGAKCKCNCFSCPDVPTKHVKLPRHHGYGAVFFGSPVQ